MIGDFIVQIDQVETFLLGLSKLKALMEGRMLIDYRTRAEKKPV